MSLVQFLGCRVKGRPAGLMISAPDPRYSIGGEFYLESRPNSTLFFDVTLLYFEDEARCDEHHLDEVFFFNYNNDLLSVADM